MGREWGMVVEGVGFRDVGVEGLDQLGFTV